MTKFAVVNPIAKINANFVKLWKTLRTFCNQAMNYITKFSKSYKYIVKQKCTECTYIHSNGL